MSEPHLESFRVFNNTRRVGVGFRFGGTEIQVPTFAILMGVVVLGAGGSMLLGMIPGWIGNLLMTVGLVLTALAVVTTFVWGARIANMAPPSARLRDKTQVMLLKSSTSHRWHQNFRTADTGERYFRNH